MFMLMWYTENNVSMREGLCIYDRSNITQRAVKYFL